MYKKQSSRKFLSGLIVFAAIGATAAWADTQSDMERLFGKKIADQTAKPKAWATKKPASATSNDKDEQASNTAKPSNFDIKTFDVMDVTVGVKLDSTVDRLSNEFPPESELSRLFPDSKFVNYAAYRCQDYGRQYGCTGKLTEYTAESQMVRSEYLTLSFTENKTLYQINQKYIGRVADNYSQCKEKLTDYKNQLISKYGQPSFMEDPRHVRTDSYTDDYGVSATWNDSAQPNDRVKISIGCTKGGKFLKQLIVQADSIKDADKKKTTTAGIR